MDARFNPCDNAVSTSSPASLQVTTSPASGDDYDPWPLTVRRISSR